MGLHDYHPNIKMVMNAELGRHNQPSNEYDPNTPPRRRLVLTPLWLVGLVRILALVGMFFLLK